MKFAFIAAKKADYPVAWMCCRVGVSTSGFYRWSTAGDPERTTRHRRLGTLVRALHAENNGVYGSPRMCHALKARGEHIGRAQTATIMRENGLVGRAPRPFRRTTDSKHDLPIAPNLVARDFEPPAKNQVWVGDITYVRTWSGWLYLAVVIDLFSRRVVGWAIADHMRTELVLSALSMVLNVNYIHPSRTTTSPQFLLTSWQPVGCSVASPYLSLPPTLRHSERGVSRRRH